MKLGREVKQYIFAFLHFELKALQNTESMVDLRNSNRPISKIGLQLNEVRWLIDTVKGWKRALGSKG